MLHQIKKKWIRKVRAARTIGGISNLSGRDFTILELLLPALEADEELRQRMISNTITPDRYKNLLLATGVNESDAETARANMQLLMLDKANGRSR